MCDCLLYSPNWGPGSQPRHVPWLGIEPAALWFTGWHSIHSSQSEISFLSKVILVLGKARSLRSPNLGCRRGWVSWVIWCFTRQLCRRHAWVDMSWWSCQWPVAHSWGLRNHPNNFHRGMFKLNTKFGANWLFCLLSHFECDDHTVHMLTQQHLLPPLTSRLKLSLFIICIPVHSPWLPSYMDVPPTILIILTVAGLFPDRPHIYSLFI